MPVISGTMTNIVHENAYSTVILQLF